MAAGLGFKDFATGEVLTAADVDGYLMQGIWVFDDAADRDAAVTSPEEGNFAFLKDTNVTTYYTGSTWANLDTTGMTNPMTTTGDTIYSSSGSTPARLGIGTAGQVLQVNSGATAPEWATPAGGGGMTLLNAGGTALSGNTTVGSIPGTYKHLFITVRNLNANAAGNDSFLRLNGDSGNNYRFSWLRCIGTTLVGSSNYQQPYIIIGSRVNSTAGFNTSMDQEIWVYNYTSTDNISVSSLSMSNDGNSASSSTVVFNTGHGKYDCSAAVTSITIASTDTLNNGIVYVYGVN
jgi:hypothetical protein